MKSIPSKYSILADAKHPIAKNNPKRTPKAWETDELEVIPRLSVRNPLVSSASKEKISWKNQNQEKCGQMEKTIGNWFFSKVQSKALKIMEKTIEKRLKRLLSKVTMDFFFSLWDIFPALGYCSFWDIFRFGTLFASGYFPLWDIPCFRIFSYLHGIYFAWNVFKRGIFFALRCSSMEYF